jgi:hypothetical protein
MRIFLVAVLAFALGLGTAFFVLSRTGLPVQAAASPVPGSARSAWTGFTQRMAALGDRVFAPDFPAGEADRVRLQRHVIGVMIEGLQFHVDHGDAANPVLMASNGRFQQWGGPNADNVYYRAHLDPSFQYRLRGNLAGIDHVAVSLSTGDMHMGAFETSRNVDVPELAPAEDGSFALTIGGDEVPGPWLAMEPDHRILSVRVYLDDWAAQSPPELFLERVGSEGTTPPEIDDAELARRITRAGDWIEANVLFWNSWLNQRLALIPDNASLPAARVAGGSDDLYYGGIAYELAPGEALLIEGPMVTGRYWGFQRSALGSFDTNYADHQTSLNHRQIRPDRHGRFQLVVSHEDPGVANWIDTEGQEQGLVTHRWIGVSERPKIETRKIRLEDLGDELPTDGSGVTPAERRQQIGVRQRQMARRP